MEVLWASSISVEFKIFRFLIDERYRGGRVSGRVISSGDFNGLDWKLSWNFSG